MCDLASLLHAQGELDEAELLYREELAGCRRALGDEHEDTLVSINDLAVVLAAHDKCDAAEPLLP